MKETRKSTTGIKNRLLSVSNRSGTIFVTNYKFNNQPELVERRHRQEQKYPEGDFRKGKWKLKRKKKKKNRLRKDRKFLFKFKQK